mmetsp:Transcript_41924/g.96201  ORF Transcript_41924/g.96201 Transcript_41924/m.96201 type:complete len:119 (-) Transcript_41924:30-386(-)
MLSSGDALQFSSAERFRYSDIGESSSTGSASQESKSRGRGSSKTSVLLASIILDLLGAYRKSRAPIRIAVAVNANLQHLLLLALSTMPWSFRCIPHLYAVLQVQGLYPAGFAMYMKAI